LNQLARGTGGILAQYFITLWREARTNVNMKRGVLKRKAFNKCAEQAELEKGHINITFRIPSAGTDRERNNRIFRRL
jgi:hypothetical protein